MIYVFDKEEKLLFILDNLKDTSCPFFNAKHKEQINGENSLEFSLLAEFPESDSIKEGCYVCYKDRDGDFQMFEIKIIEDDSAENRIRHFYCENVGYELLDDYLEDVPVVNNTAQQCLTTILQNTRWEVGIVTADKVASTRFYRESVMSGIKNKFSKWEGELKFRVIIEGNQVTHRYVDYYKSRGADNGVRFEHSKDIVNSKRTVDTTTLKTALYGFGKGEQLDEDSYGRRINFEGVEWKISNGDPMDKPLGQAWLGDPTALQLWGRGSTVKRHRRGVFEDKDETNPSDLLWKTYAELIKVSKPNISYSLSVVDLSTYTDYSHKKFRLGDTITVVDKDFKPALIVKSRIVEIVVDLVSPEETQLTLENILPDFSTTELKLSQLEDLVHDRQGIWDTDTASEFLEYKVGTVLGTSAKVYFNNEYITEPALFFSIKNHTNSFFDYTFDKYTNSEGIQSYIGVDLVFATDQVGKAFSLLILGGK